MKQAIKQFKDRVEDIILKDNFTVEQDKVGETYINYLYVDNVRFMFKECYRAIELWSIEVSILIENEEAVELIKGKLNINN